MYHMECRDLIISLPQYKEERVKKLCKFTEKVPPTDLCHLQIIGTSSEKKLAKNVSKEVRGIAMIIDDDYHIMQGW